MELRHLRYFVAIAEERSFTRAAERLWVAQPGLSTQMRRLEAELGVKLFERHTRGVDVTQAGELFLERARLTLAAAETAAATGRDLEAGVIGSVSLGLAASDLLALTTTPRALPTGVVIRPLDPQRTLSFELLTRDEPLSPALAAFVGLAASSPEHPSRRSLAAVA